MLHIRRVLPRIILKYCGQIKHWGLLEGSAINLRDFSGRIYYWLLFHNCNGMIDVTGYVRGRKYIKIGKDFTTGKNFRLEAIKITSNRNPCVTIKNNVSFSDFNHVGAVNYIEIGNNVLFGSKCYVTDHNHGIYSGDGEQSNPDIPPAERPLSVDKKVIIEDNVWLGDNVIVLPGVIIGKGSIIGSNAVVSRSIPPYSIAVGIPARVIKQWKQENQRWEFV